MTKKIHTLGVFSLVMITVGSVGSIRNLPATALFGSSAIFFFALAAILFFLPSALVATELASGDSTHQGIYSWVSAAFGKHVGFFAIWFQWIENVIWYPTLLSFVAGTAAYFINSALAHNKFFLISVILAAFWGTTFINLKGIKSSAIFANICTLFGLLVPMTLIIALGIFWLTTGHRSEIHFTYHSIVPNITHAQTWVALVGIIMSFCGIEIATVHTEDVNNPKSTYPRAMLIATIIIFLTLVFGSLTIAVVLPTNHINLVAGIMQVFSTFFHTYHLGWLLPLIAFSLVLGGLGGVNNWIIAPTRGLLVAAKDERLPKYFQKENEHGAPKRLLIIQAIIVSIIALVFLLMPSVNGSYWLLTALAAQLYMMMYILMFLSALVLRYRHKRTNTFQIGGGRLGIWIVCITGILTALGAMIAGFIPPHNINIGSSLRYEGLLILGLVIMSLPPVIACRLCCITSRQVVCYKF